MLNTHHPWPVSAPAAVFFFNPQDQLHWDKAHILGFSMGGMVAQRLAVAAPSRVASLTLLSTSAGGWQIVPKHSWSGLRTAFRMVTAR
jgi:pimeloyl-ACP methyl ester carboxylesterase